MAINSDRLRERLRERVVERRWPREFTYYADDDGNRYCLSCDGSLTDADWEAGACTQCSEPLFEVNDESVDEHLHEDDGDC